MILLDTHILVWLVEDSPKAGADLRAEISAAQQRRDVLVSAMSFWELAMLVSKRRMQLSLAIRDWADVILEREGVNLAAFTPKIAIECWSLPLGLNADPVDRALVATARVLEATLVTRDRDILRYGEQGHVKVMAA